MLSITAGPGIAFGDGRCDVGLPRALAVESVDRSEERLDVEVVDEGAQAPDDLLVQGIDRLAGPSAAGGGQGVAGHDSSLRSRRIARERRDLTVPGGQPSAAAVSASDRSR